ncbi:hypothetical protein IANJMKHF_00285 [Klebsiella phage CPRSA]|nr:hypothetical protein IANJMKHF_00285 [Klebsiella phage CPRSA]
MKHKYDKAVVIGRFQPFHYGHERNGKGSPCCC